MPDNGFERLSVRDSSLLLGERHDRHMHLSTVAIFEGGPLADPEHGLDIQSLREFVVSRLHLVPRYRQRIETTPLQSHPVWVDDDRFNIAYHVRHTALPRPGDLDALKTLVGRILSQKLDRTKPLWELWFAEGLDGGRFAVIMKTHQCMLSDEFKASLLSALLRSSQQPPTRRTGTWIPRPAPGPLALAASDVAASADVPVAAARALGKALLRPRRASRSAAEGIAAFWQLVTSGLQVASDTPLNRPVGPHRRVDWHSLDRAELRDIADRLDGSVDAVVLTIMSGAMRAFLRRRRVGLRNLHYRVVIPVRTGRGRRPSQEGDPSAWILHLPLATRDPLKRFRRIQADTRRLAEGKTAEGAAILFQFADWSGSPGLTHAGSRLIAGLQPYNMTVATMPGPRKPVHLLGSRLQLLFPQFPLLENQGLGISTLAYGDRLTVSLVADWDLVPDLSDLVADVEGAFKELREAAVGAGAKRRSARAGRATPVLREVGRC